MEKPHDIHRGLGILDADRLKHIEQGIVDRRIDDAVPIDSPPLNPGDGVMHNDERLFDWAKMIIAHSVTFGPDGSYHTRDEGDNDDRQQRTFVPESFELFNHV